MKYKSVRQYESTDCASACIASISWYYGKKVSIPKLQQYTNINKDGSSVFDIIQACEKIGLKAIAAKKTETFNEDIGFEPCIAHVFLEDGRGHYLVIYAIKKEKIVVSDPAIGLMNIDKKDFFNFFFSEQSPYVWSGILIFVEPGEDFKKIIVKGKNNLSFAKFIFAERKLSLQIFFLSLCSMIFNILNAYYYKILFDVLIPKMWINSLILCTLFFIIVNIINIVINKSRIKKALDISRNMNLKLSTEYYKKVLNLACESLNKREKGEFISRFQDINSIQEILVTSILTLPVDIMFIIIVGIILGTKSIKFLIIVLMMCIAFGVISVLYKNDYLTNNSKQMISRANLMSYLIDSLDGVETIKTFCQEVKFYENGKLKLLNWQNSIVNIGVIENKQTALKTVINSLGRFAIMCIGAIDVIYGKITVGDLVTYNIFIGYLLKPINDIINLQPQFHAAQVAMERLDVIMQSLSEDGQGKKLTNLKKVVFDNIDFAYNTEHEVLKGLNLNIAKGEKIAIVGDNGSGKTTIAKLLVKFYSSNSGKIYLDNEEIAHIDKESIRKNIIYVSQEDFILSASIKENLKFGNEVISDDKLLHIAKITGVHDFVESLPRLYESILEEKGCNLSKGQKQKIAIARALLREPQMLILDEATSGMDIFSGSKIMKYLREDENLTLIVITHKLDDLKDFDCIYVINEGKIVVQGKYNEILRKISGI